MVNRSAYTKKHTVTTQNKTRARKAPIDERKARRCVRPVLMMGKGPRCKGAYQ